MASVGYATVSVIPSAKNFGSNLSKQVNPGLKSAGSEGGKHFGGGMLDSAKKFVGPLVGLFAAKLGVDFLKDAIGGASDLNESVSKVGVVFGSKFAPQVVAASKTAATSMGLSQNAYLAATGTLGNLLVSLNIAPKAAVGMSQSMVKLAGDLASFNNVSPEVALDAIRSGLTGETEPLKQFGVNMNDATLKAQALKMHLIKTTQEAMSPQTKALAAQALIMAQTGTAQGDFARTSGGLANQQRILSAQTEDLKTKIGGALLPVVTQATTAANKFATEFTNGTGTGGKFRDVLTDMKTKGEAVVSWLKDNTGALKVTAAVFGVLTVAVQAHNLAMFISSGRLKEWILQTAIVRTATATWAAIQWVLNGALLANPIGLVVLAIGLLVGAFIVAYQRSETFRAVVDTTFKGIQIIVGNVVSVVIQLFRNMLAVWSTVIGGVLSAAATVAEKLGLPFASGLRSASNSFNSMAANADAKLRGVAGSASTWGDATGRNYAAGISAQGKNLNAVAASVASQVKYGLHIDAYPIGQAIAQGLANGIHTVAPAAVAEATAMANAVHASVKFALKVASPSKVMADIGGQIGQGLIVGMNSQRGNVGAAMASLVQVPGAGSMDFASPAARASAIGGGTGDAGLLAEVQGLRADIRALPRDYQMGQRQFVGVR